MIQDRNNTADGESTTKTTNQNDQKYTQLYRNIYYNLIA